MDDSNTTAPVAATPMSLEAFNMRPDRFQRMIEDDQHSSCMIYEGGELSGTHFNRVEVYSDFAGGVMVALHDHTEPPCVLVLMKPPSDGIRRIAEQIIKEGRQ